MCMHIIRLGPINLTVSDVALIGCLAILIIRHKINHTPFGQATFVWCAGLSLMLGGLLAGSIVNGDPLRWMVIAGQYLFSWLLLPMLFFGLPHKQMQRCLLWYVYGVCASQALAISASLAFPQQSLVPLFGPGFVAGNGRIGALSGEVNWNGAVIGFALPMLISCLHYRLIGKVGTFICAALLLAGLISSASFTGFCAGIIAVVITLGLANPRRLFTAGVPLVGLVVGYIVTGLPLPAIFEKRVAGALTTGDMSHAGTFEDRSILIAEAWKLSEHTIVLGLGADRYRDVSIFAAPVHQFPLLVLVEGGAIALTGLVIMLVALWFVAIKAVRVDRFGGAAAVAVLAVFCIYTTAAPHMYTRLYIGPLFMALAAVARLPARWNTRTLQPRQANGQAS